MNGCILLCLHSLERQVSFLLCASAYVSLWGESVTYMRGRLRTSGVSSACCGPAEHAWDAAELHQVITRGSGAQGGGTGR